MYFRLVSGTLVATLVAAAAWGCGGGGGGSTPTAPSGSTPPPAPATTTVTVAVVGSVGNTAYQPNPVRARVGDTVMFRNADVTMHHIVMDDGSADLGDVNPGRDQPRIHGGERHGPAVPLHHPPIDGRQLNGAEAPEPPPCIDSSGYAC